MEEWRPIKGYEGKYEISSMGRVKALPKFVNHSRNSNYKVFHGEKVIKSANNGNGYRYISLTINGKRKNHYIHRLVADAFLGGIPDGMVVDHIDHNRGNNAVENLRIVTQKENTNHSRHLMLEGMKKRRKPKSTGERYITKRRNRYEFYIERLHIYKSFETLEEAVMFRDEITRSEVV